MCLIWLFGVLIVMLVVHAKVEESALANFLLNEGNIPWNIYCWLTIKCKKKKKFSYMLDFTCVKGRFWTFIIFFSGVWFHNWALELKCGWQIGKKTLVISTGWEDCTHFEDPTQSSVVQSIWAFENHTLLGHNFSQVFGCLCFPRASWTLRGPLPNGEGGDQTMCWSQRNERQKANGTPDNLSVICSMCYLHVRFFDRNLSN